MSEAPNFDPSYGAAMVVTVAVMVMTLIHLIPILFHVLSQIVPSVLILMMIVVVLRGMLAKFLD